MAKATYKDAGVDLEVYRDSMARLPKLLQRTFTPRVVRSDGKLGGYSLRGGVTLKRQLLEAEGALPALLPLGR